MIQIVGTGKQVSFRGVSPGLPRVEGLRGDGLDDLRFDTRSMDERVLAAATEGHGQR